MVIEDRAILGGLAAVHQFVRVGRLAIIGGCSKLVQDVVPFATADGYPARIYGLNKIGLDRAGVDKKTQQELERAFRILFRSRLSAQNALERIEKELFQNDALVHFVQFIRSSKRGFCRGLEGARKEPAWNG